MVLSRRLIITTFLLAFSSLVAADNGAGAEETKATKPALEEMFQKSEWVLRLHIEGVGQLVNPAMSRNHLMAVQGYRYSASVLQSWKGEQSGTIRFQVELDDCPHILQVDREYIVFGSSNYHGVLETDSCEKIVAPEETDALLPQLERLLAGG